MEVHNRDIFPTAELADAFSLVAPVVVNSLLDAPFLAHEKAANEAKLRFHRQGRLAILLVLLSTLFTVAERLVIPPFPGIRQVSIAFVLLGIIGLVIQVRLLLTKQKQVWLCHRFAAERLRSIKFQAYPLAVISESTQDLQDQANAFYSKQVSILDSELNAGYSAFVNFSPHRGLAEKRVAGGTPKNAAIAAAAREAYKELRISYQRRFAEGEILQIQQHERIGYTAADILYLSGAVLAVAALTCKVLYPEAADLISWIDFLAIAGFVGGMVKTIMDNASLVETSKVRYEDYLHALSECEGELESEGADFPEIVHRIERVVLGELSDFCQAAAHISYRL